MPSLAWRTPRTASWLQLAILVPRLLRTYAAPTAAAVLITSNALADEQAAIYGHDEPETPPGSSCRYSYLHPLTSLGADRCRYHLPPPRRKPLFFRLLDHRCVSHRISVLVEARLVGRVGVARRCLRRSDPRVDGTRPRQSARSVSFDRHRGPHRSVPFPWLGELSFVSISQCCLHLGTNRNGKMRPR